jgi:hypothetical protein
VRIVTKLNSPGSSRGQSRHRLLSSKIVRQELVLSSMGAESSNGVTMLLSSEMLASSSVVNLEAPTLGGRETSTFGVTRRRAALETPQI